MIELSAVAGLCIVGLCLIIVSLIRASAKERSELHDRIMALSDPNNFVQYKAVAEPQEGNVTYVDEAFEYEHGTES